MRPGPVFQAELMTLARQPRFFVGRMLYGLLVLLIVSSTYRSMVRSGGYDAEIPIERLAWFGQAIFSSFATLQGLIVLALTPSLVAGAIADERQRKTLHYLMASRLSSTEIILGKVGARLLRVAVIGAIGLPVLSLLSLFGGVDPLLVLVVYGATATTTFFLASIAICCSIHAAKPREAILRAYFIGILWLTVAPLALTTEPFWEPFWRAIFAPLRPAVEWLAVCSPTDLLRTAVRGFFDARLLIASAAWMMGSQLVYGTLLIVYATLRLRPVYRGEGQPSWWRRMFRTKEARVRWRLWPRPSCGNDAMLWKEMYLIRANPLKRVGLFLTGLAAVGLTIYATWDTLILAAGEVVQSGWDRYGTNQRDVNTMLRATNAVLIVVILIGVGSSAATSISSEREGDTWINLTASPIDGVEVIRGKIIGSIWAVRSLFLLLAGSWLFGLAIGAVHPLGVCACAVELMIFAWFAAALGVRISLRSRNTIQALTWTIGLLVLLNAGYMLIFLMFQPDTMLVLVGCMPFHFTVSLLGMDEIRAFRPRSTNEAIGAVVGGTILYATGATYLTVRSILRYDAVVDRPSRSRRGITPAALLNLQPDPPKAAVVAEL